MKTNSPRTSKNRLKDKKRGEREIVAKETIQISNGLESGVFLIRFILEVQPSSARLIL